MNEYMTTDMYIYIYDYISVHIYIYIHVKFIHRDFEFLLVMMIIMVYIAARYVQDTLIVFCGCDVDGYVLFHAGHGSNVRRGRIMISRTDTNVIYNLGISQVG